MFSDIRKSTIKIIMNKVKMSEICHDFCWQILVAIKFQATIIKN